MKCWIPQFVAVLLLAGCGERAFYESRSGQRIVSMAPNTTEILYALGLGSNVVGVSRYTAYPPEAVEKPSVGGTYDPNLEMVVVLQPDLVVGLDSQNDIAAQLQTLGIPFLGVPHERVEEILTSIQIIGDSCGVPLKARELVDSLRIRLDELHFPAESQKRVLVCVGHDENLTRMYVAGKNTFYDDLITLAGAVNACEQAAVKYPEISPEGLRIMSPDLVIDILPASQLDPNGAPTAWDAPSVTMTNQYAFIPGPRFVLLLEDFKKAISGQNNLGAE